MKALIQRVVESAVRVDGEIVGEIGAGILALVAIEPADDQAQIKKMAHKLLGYRIFEDAAGKMNLSLTDTQGGLLLVSQFTLAADTRKGMRPSFSSAAEPAKAAALFKQLVEELKAQHPKVETGCFGADMQVSLVNDGPVTFLLECP